ncbi:MAG TPA: SpoIVB peptidase S55 domain-containing protein [Opitutaceae bacterium]|nr:SpoIVB peptidase S55 domain-containing protein [Opitutaceae bacterium]
MKLNLSSLLCIAGLFIASFSSFAQQPVNAGILPLDELKAGMKGEVWTVFQGTQPEPFAVEVTGVVRNAIGPGKSLILCQLTDPRVQHMGAVAGMSGSPLYIEGRLAGALSYQIQRFETVRFAGFTPAADLAEVQAKLGARPVITSTSLDRTASADSIYKPLQPAFTLSGLSPAVTELLAPQFAALGLGASALGGSTNSGGTEANSAAVSSAPLVGGSAVAVALATGDITLAGTGTVSRVDGNQITAFGHPMLTLGDVALPMCAAEIVTILPSSMSSIKVANTGRIIGTITQDRLSAVSGTIGAGPSMTEVEVLVTTAGADSRTLRFSVARQQQLTPLLVAAGVTQAILGTNEAGFSNGFRLSSDVTFGKSQTLSAQTLYSGPQGFAQGISEFVKGLSADLQNPYEKTFPSRVTFKVEALEQNPTITLEVFQLSRRYSRSGETVQATIGWRDWQGETHRELIDIAIDPAWAGKQLEIVLAPGRALDDLTGRPRVLAASQLRSFEAYLAAMRDDRAADGLYLAVAEKSSFFTDQGAATPDTPGSIERIARAADEARFRKREALLPLWEQRILSGKLATATLHRPLSVVE